MHANVWLRSTWNITSDWEGFFVNGQWSQRDQHQCAIFSSNGPFSYINGPFMHPLCVASGISLQHDVIVWEFILKFVGNKFRQSKMSRKTTSQRTYFWRWDNQIFFTYKTSSVYLLMEYWFYEENMLKTGNIQFYLQRTKFVGMKLVWQDITKNQGSMNVFSKWDNHYFFHLKHLQWAIKRTFVLNNWFYEESVWKVATIDFLSKEPNLESLGCRSLNFSVVGNIFPALYRSIILWPSEKYWWNWTSLERLKLSISVTDNEACKGLYMWSQLTHRDITAQLSYKKNKIEPALRPRAQYNRLVMRHFRC